MLNVTVFYCGSYFVNKTLHLKIIVILVPVFAITSLKADIPYYLDFKYILNESTAGKKAQNALKSKLDKGFKNLKLTPMLLLFYYNS